MHVTLPDYQEKRDGKVLLIWSQTPYWLVADHEFLSFIHDYKDADSWSDLSNYKDGKRIVRSLKNTGIFDAPKAFKQDDSIRNITVNLTNQCNLRCSFCYNTPSDDYLSAGEVTGFLRDIRPFCSKHTSLMVLGGEPLLKPDLLVKTLTQASKLYAKVLISTNGLLVTREFARLFRKLKVEVQISLDSATPEFHDSVRGAGMWQRAVDGVKELVCTRAYSILNMVVSNSNMHEIGEYVTLGGKLGVNEVRCIPLRPIGRALHSELTTPSLVNLAMALEAQKKTRIGRKLLKRDFASIIKESCRLSYPKQSCGAGSEAIFLNADGRIYPCTNLSHEQFSFGSIRDRTVNEIFAGDARKKFIDSHTVSQYDGCKDCLLNSWCAGGCRGETLANSGDTHAVGHNCAEYRKAFLQTMWAASERI